LSEIQGQTSDKENGYIRFHFGKAWQLRVLQVDKGYCQICDEGGCLCLLEFRRPGILIGQEEDLERSSQEFNVRDVTPICSPGSARICNAPQAEAGGVSDMVSPEDYEAFEAMVHDLSRCSPFPPDVGTGTEDMYVAQCQPISDSELRSEAVVHPWYDPAWEDELNSMLGTVLPYVLSPSE